MVSYEIVHYNYSNGRVLRSKWQTAIGLVFKWTKVYGNAGAIQEIEDEHYQ